MTKPSDNWKPCDGELGSLVSNLRRGEATRQTMSRRAFMGTACTFVVGGGLFLTRANIAAAMSPSMTCFEARRCGNNFIAGTLDKTQLIRLETHLGKCPSCVSFIDQLREELNGCSAKNELPV